MNYKDRFYPIKTSTIPSVITILKIENKNKSGWQWGIYEPEYLVIITTTETSARPAYYLTPHCAQILL